jgi:hypothetical protein
MAIVVGILLVAGALASALATAFAFALQRGDPAGRGLGQAYLVVALAVTWLLVASAVVAAVLVPAGANGPANGAMTFGALVAGITSALASLPYLCGTPARGAVSFVVRANLFVVPAALLVHAAWRAAVLPMPSAWATHGCLGLVAAGTVLAWLALALGRKRNVAPTPLYPALLVRTGAAPAVVRAAADLADRTAGRLADDARLLDARGVPWDLIPGPAGPNPVPAGTTLPFADICGLLLALPRLHEDPTEDARIRRLIPQQRDVTALTFLLPQ